MTRKTFIDINCDLGEEAGNDEAVLPFVTSANIACGFHAGSPDEMRRVIKLCLQHDVGIGAHPGFNDRENFGRLEMQLRPAQVYDIVVEQIRTLRTIAGEQNAQLAHVKPHGALYNMAARDAQLADVIAAAVRDVDPALVLFGLANSQLIEAGKRAGLETAAEGFADRNYMPDGSLVPRTRGDAMIEDVARAVENALRLANSGWIDTICIHGDGPHAVEFARALHEALAHE